MDDEEDVLESLRERIQKYRDTSDRLDEMARAVSRLVDDKLLLGHPPMPPFVA